jgi:hypothetical protein
MGVEQPHSSAAGAAASRGATAGVVSLSRGLSSPGTLWWSFYLPSTFSPLPFPLYPFHSTPWGRYDPPWQGRGWLQLGKAFLVGTKHDKTAGKSRQPRWTMDDILQVRDLVVPHVARLWAASGQKEIARQWKAIHDMMAPLDLTWMVDAVERYQDASSFVAWVKDPTIPFFPPVTCNVTLNPERTDDGYLMRWDIACVRTDEPDAWVAMYRVVMNAADEGGKGILRHLARTDVLLFSVMSGKDHGDTRQPGKQIIPMYQLG